MLKIAHRGASGHEPENTISAFKKAIELQADMIELDARLCETGELVVMHDKDLKRTTNGNGLVSFKSIDELKFLTVGENEKIPTLKESLNYINQQCQVNIELVSKDSGRAVANLLKSNKWDLDNILVSSFRINELKEFNSFLPDVKLGYLAMEVTMQQAKELNKLSFYSIGLEKNCLKNDVFVQLQELGLKVFAFTVNDDKDIEHFKQMGINGIITDYPDRLD
jgi:glycerophosphoryl diester phosphodiesterase